MKNGYWNGSWNTFRSTASPGGEGAFAGRLKEEFGKMGIAAAQDRAGEHAGNLFVSIPGNEEQEPLLFTAHMDTVVPGRGICPKIRDGLIFSGGDTILAGTTNPVSRPSWKRFR